MNLRRTVLFAGLLGSTLFCGSSYANPTQVPAVRAPQVRPVAPRVAPRGATAAARSSQAAGENGASAAPEPTVDNDAAAIVSATRSFKEAEAKVVEPNGSVRVVTPETAHEAAQTFATSLGQAKRAVGAIAKTGKVDRARSENETLAAHVSDSAAHLDATADTLEGRGDVEAARSLRDGVATALEEHGYLPLAVRQYAKLATARGLTTKQQEAYSAKLLETTGAWIDKLAIVEGESALQPQTFIERLTARLQNVVNFVRELPGQLRDRFVTTAVSYLRGRAQASFRGAKADFDPLETELSGGVKIGAPSDAQRRAGFALAKASGFLRLAKLVAPAGEQEELGAAAENAQGRALVMLGGQPTLEGNDSRLVVALKAAGLNVTLVKGETPAADLTGKNAVITYRDAGSLRTGLRAALAKAGRPVPATPAEPEPVLVATGAPLALPASVAPSTPDAEPVATPSTGAPVSRQVRRALERRAEKDRVSAAKADERADRTRRRDAINDAKAAFGAPAAASPATNASP